MLSIVLHVLSWINKFVDRKRVILGSCSTVVFGNDHDVGLVAVIDAVLGSASSFCRICKMKDSDLDDCTFSIPRGVCVDYAPIYDKTIYLYEYWCQLDWPSFMLDFMCHTKATITIAKSSGPGP